MTSALLAFVVPVLMQPVVRGAWGQGEISGRVIAADSGRPPVQGAEAVLVKLGRMATSDSSGRFRFRDVPPGEHLLVLRAIGFKSESSTVFIDRDEVVSSQLVMTRSTGTTLPERVVEAPASGPPAKLVEFIERQKLGTGHFITRDELAKAEGGFRQTGDLISLVPGVLVRRGSNKIWIASGRAFGGGCAFCSRTVASLSLADVAAGARPACFLDVYLDGAMVFDSRHPENGLFDVNTVPPEHIAAIEVYTSGAQLPAKYNRTGGGCGVLLIWTR
jgi:carboxypeptidase family protein